MNYKKFLGAASAALIIVIAITLVPAPAAGAASKYKVLHKFHSRYGSDPEPDSRLIFDAAGNLYGTTMRGGDEHNCESGCGIVFKLTPNADGSWTESRLHAFHGGHDGEYPMASLIFDAAGNLYGTTIYGGGDNDLCAEGCGVVFKLTPNADGSWTESVLHSFGGDGAFPGDLIFDAAGNLYGTTGAYGTYWGGMVFKLTPNADGSWTGSVLHSFNGSDGSSPGGGGLVFDAVGNLYGTTYDGGASSGGTVFKLAPNQDGSWTESVLHSFKGHGGDGYNPYAGLIFDTAGNLYGTTDNGSYCYGGCGVVFKLTPNADGSWTESVLHRFAGTGAAYPQAGLIFDATGNLYGTATYGGPANGGAAFKLSPNQDGSWAYRLLHVFQGTPALYPSGLVLGSAGTLYGTTAKCSSNSGCSGVVYQITP